MAFSLEEALKKRPKIPKKKHQTPKKTPKRIWDPPEPNPSNVLANERESKTNLTPIERESKTNLTPIERESKTNLTPIERESKQDLTPFQEDTSSSFPPAQKESKSNLTPFHPQFTHSQKSLTPIEKGSKQDLTPIERESKQDLTPIERESKQDLTPIEKGVKNRTPKGVKNRLRLPSPQLRKIIGFLHFKEEEYADLTRSQPGSGTGWITKDEIAQAVGTTKKTVRSQLRRLLQNNWIQITECKSGQHGGLRFSVTYERKNELSPELFWRIQRESKTAPQRESKTDVSSSSSLLTTNDKALAQKLETSIERFGLSQHGFGANDALSAWRSGVFSTEAEFIESLEHLGWYLESDQSSGLDHKRAWAIRQLKKGYYPPPAGFESSEERQVRVRLEAERTKRERLLRLREELEGVEFENWLLELTDEKRRALLKDLPHGNVDSPAARPLLREAFKRERA